MRRDGAPILISRFGNGGFANASAGIWILVNYLILMTWRSWMPFVLCELMQSKDTRRL
jgi:hypothetical protein